MTSHDALMRQIYTALGRTQHALAGVRDVAPQLRGTLDISIFGLRWDLKEDRRTFNESSSRRRWQGKVHIPGHDAVAVLLARADELTVSVTVAPGPRVVVAPTKIHGTGTLELQKLLTHASKLLTSKLRLEEPEQEEEG